MKLKKGVLKHPMLTAAKIGVSIAKAPIRAMKKGMAKAASAGAIAGGIKARKPKSAIGMLRAGMMGKKRY